jgi:hypothetical protein
MYFQIKTISQLNSAETENQKGWKKQKATISGNL